MCSQEEIAGFIEQAVTDLFVNDQHLLDVQVNERSLSHKLACYLDKVINTSSRNKNLSVDAEYNRYQEDIKTLSDDSNQTRIYPDIIIHQRGNQDNNILVLEIKKGDKIIDAHDKRKLEGLTSDLGAYKYHYGVWLSFGKDKIVGLDGYINGVKNDEFVEILNRKLSGWLENSAS